MAILKTDGVDGTKHYPIRTVTLQATGAITKGDAVMINTGAHADLLSGFGQLYCVKQADADDSPLAVGIALETVAAPPTNKSLPIKVQISGKVGTGDDAAPDASAAAITIAYLVGTSTTAGKIKELGTISKSVQPFATCLKAYSSGDTDGIIVIHDKGWY
jgi:hypothetical protein